MDPRLLGGNSGVAPLLELILTNPTPALAPGYRIPVSQSLVQYQGLLDTRHHNWFIALALGMVPDNNDFHHEGNQQVRKLISTCKVIYRALVCTHTPYFLDTVLYKSEDNGLGLAHKLPVAILMPGFHSTPVGEQGCLVNLRARVDDHARQVMVDMYPERVRLHSPAELQEGRGFAIRTSAQHVVS